jgi:predicted GIY-YIG superfamily endonuclease
MVFFVYILKCADDSYYAGSTSDIERRVWEHETGEDPRAYTYKRRPVNLVWCGDFPTKIEALRFEKQIKGVKDERRRRERNK